MPEENPFESIESRYAHAKFQPFNQEALLNPQESGVCLALCYEWINSFYTAEEEYTINLLGEHRHQFWKRLNDPEFIDKLRESQRSYDLPAIEYSIFKSSVANIAAQYGFDDCTSTISRRYSISSPDKQQIIQDLVTKNAGQIYFLLKKFGDSNGHAIAMAATMNNMGVLRIGFFEPNYGEIIFTYSTLDLAEISSRTEWVINELHDTWMPTPIKTFYEFCDEIFTRYKEEGIYHYFKYLSITHKKEDMHLKNESMSEQREEISKALYKR